MATTLPLVVDGHNRVVATTSVEQVDPRATVWLRRKVLRPNQQPAEIAAETDVPGMFAIGAFVERALVCCVVAHPDAFPAEPETEPETDPAWRLRGMATDPQHRGQGHGAAVLERMLEELRLRDAAIVWCNARTPARTLYARAGFEVVGAEWVDPEIGPHVRMWRRL
ncbi:GNAT family N-acetyltransferase [Nocardioides montaniterrae]